MILSNTCARTFRDPTNRLLTFPALLAFFPLRGPTLRQYLSHDRFKMVSIHIRGVPIDFPYDPYPAQIRYMSAVIAALQKGHNALLESPTGTGKTLCLLCAALAWRQMPVTAPTTKNSAIRPINGSGKVAESVTSPFSAALSPPRIVFSSRTHTQLSQVISELRKTVYKPGMTILASRDQLCLHPCSSTASGPRLNAQCRRMTAPNKRQCQYHHPVMSNRPHENRAPALVDALFQSSPVDIEDLRSFGTRQTACPYYLSRLASRADGCEVLFLPYNYLIDPDTRASLDIDWSNDIVIVDEAHNLPAVAADAMSFNLPAGLRKQCDRDMGLMLEAATRPGGISIPALESLKAEESGLDSVIGTENREMLEVRLMRTILRSLEDFISTADLDRAKDSDRPFQVFPAAQLRKLLEDAGGPTRDSYEDFLRVLERAIEQSAAANALRALHGAVRVLFTTIAEGSEDAFRTVIHASNDERTLSYWCLRPSIAMRGITRLNLRTLVLTSGTLSPMDSFASDLGVSFPVRLENPHVITANQLCARIVRSGPSLGNGPGGRLTSAFRARGAAMSLELGRTIIRVASVVPDGLLVFFPSYGALNEAIDVWKNFGPGPDRRKPSVWELIQRHKRVVAEEKDSMKFAAALLAHRANVDSGSGSVLLAVCRGKVSEGIDFSDEYGRAVLITGLPYPSALDARVVLQREYADAEAKRKGLTGGEWYATQAMRAVNQAVGRAIRHRFDYGAILLCDERFQAESLRNIISRWIRPHLAVSPVFVDAEAALKHFFEGARRSEFAREGERRRHQRREQVGPEDDRTENVEIAQEAIRKIAPPPRTDADFLKRVQALSDGLKDTPKEQSQTSPSGNVFTMSTVARGGLVDSGVLRVPRTRQEGGPKRSARFLASRVVVKKAREEKLSERIRRVFERGHQRQFLALFQRVLSSHKILSEAPGPVHDDSAREKGEQALRELIELSRVHAKAGEGEILLTALRAKMPQSFRKAYERFL